MTSFSPTRDALKKQKPQNTDANDDAKRSRPVTRTAFKRERRDTRAWAGPRLSRHEHLHRWSKTSGFRFQDGRTGGPVSGAEKRCAVSI